MNYDLHWQNGSIVSKFAVFLLRKNTLSMTQARGARDSGDDVFGDIAMHIGQAEITTGVAIGQLFMIQTKQV